MNLALIVTIWAALACFVATEFGRRRALEGQSAARWMPWASVFGLLSLAVHFLIAFATVHGWSHEAAVRATARQTAAVYGLDWGGGVYVNYLFLAVWAIDAWTWRHRARSSLMRSSTVRSSTLTWMLRAFYLTIIFNAAVVFVPGPRRWAGLAFTLLLLWVWRPYGERGS